MPQSPEGGAHQAAEIAAKMTTFSNMRVAMRKYQAKELEKKIRKEKRKAKLAAKLDQISAKIIISDSPQPSSSRRVQNGLIGKIIGP